MRPCAWILVGLLGVACTDDGKSSGDDTGGASTDDTAAPTDGDADADDTGDVPDLDQDGDGFDGGDAGDDCDDDDATVYPGADEVAYDGIDQDCDGADLTDVDGDGFDGGDDGDDCDDDDATAYPGADEVAYDGLDQDCDGADLTDVDGDGFDGGDEGDDCNDEDAAVYPGAEDAWYDGVDSDCAGNDDYDADADGYVEDVYEGLATEGVSDSGALPGGDCDDADAGYSPGADDVAYDGLDQDCDGADLTDVDGDGYDSTVVEGGTDCDDGDDTIHPDAEDTADLVDSDCDGLVDDDSILAGDIVVNEVMVNPVGDLAVGYEVADANGEWFELYNTTDFDINIVNWTIWDDGTDNLVIDADVIVPAGGYAVLGTNGDETTNGGVTLDHVYAYGNLRLANTDDEFYMAMGDEEIYAITWYAADWPYTSGYAMGWDGLSDWTDFTGWCAQTSTIDSGDAGTPGAVNDSCLDFTCAAGDLSGSVMSGSGDTTDSDDDFDHSCGYSSGEPSAGDDAWAFTPDESGCYEATQTGIDWVPTLSLYAHCGGGELDCSSGDLELSSTGDYVYAASMQLAADAGETYLIIADGRGMSYSDYGAYDLEISLVEDVPTTPEGGESLGSDIGDAVVSGTTEGLVAGGEFGCTTSYGGTDTLTWTAPSTGCWNFDLSESDYDTVIAVFQEGDACGPDETCDDDTDGLTSSVDVNVASGEEVTILIGGWGSSEGDYVLDINTCSE